MIRAVGEYVLLSQDEYEKLGGSGTGASTDKPSANNKQDGTGKRERLEIKPIPLIRDLMRLRRDGIMKYDVALNLLDESGKSLGSVQQLTVHANQPHDESIADLPGVRLVCTRASPWSCAVCAYKEHNTEEGGAYVSRICQETQVTMPDAATEVDVEADTHSRLSQRTRRILDNYKLGLFVLSLIITMVVLIIKCTTTDATVGQTADELTKLTALVEPIREYLDLHNGSATTPAAE